MSVREQQKQATRAKVLAAARDLFDEIGYEETTIRAIAEQAKVSVGSVFTTFCSKADILGQITAERVGQLAADLERVAPHLRGSTLDRLLSLVAIHYDFQMQRPKLYLAYLAASYSMDRPASFFPLGSNRALGVHTQEVLEDGVARGELRADLDIELAMQMIAAVYAFNYLRAAEGAPTSVMTAAVERQIRELFTGFAAKPGPDPNL